MLEFIKKYFFFFNRIGTFMDFNKRKFVELCFNEQSRM